MYELSHTHIHIVHYFYSFYIMLMFFFQPNLVGAEDEVPLLVAASNGDTPLLKLLVDHGADVNVQVSK